MPRFDQTYEKEAELDPALLDLYDTALANNRTLCDLRVCSPLFQLSNPHHLYGCVANDVTVSTEAQQVLRLSPFTLCVTHVHCLLAADVAVLRYDVQTGRGSQCSSILSGACLQ